MKQHPILFSTPMVTAIMEGRKTQTRRIAKVPNYDHFAVRELKCPFGNIGDVLWVRETFSVVQSGHSTVNSVTGGYIPLDPVYVYKADGHESPKAAAHFTNMMSDSKGWEAEDNNWKPSLFMPRKGCRLYLEITKIRVERLQDISEGDALFEGVTGMSGDYERTPSACFEDLWISINGKESWDENPWVWVIEFKQIKKPL